MHYLRTKKLKKNISFMILTATLSNSFLPLYAQTLDIQQQVELLGAASNVYNEIQLDDTLIETLRTIASLTDVYDEAPLLFSMLEHVKQGYAKAHTEYVLEILDNEALMLLEKYHVKIADDEQLENLIKNLDDAWQLITSDHISSSSPEELTQTRRQKIEKIFYLYVKRVAEINTLFVDRDATIVGNLNVYGGLSVNGVTNFTNLTVAGVPVTGIANGTLDVQQLQLLENPSNGTNFITLQAPASLAANYTLIFPPDSGTFGQTLTTNGSGVLNWSTVPSMASTFVQNGNSFGALATLGTNDTFGLNLETNGLARMQISSSGAITINTPTSGVALAIVGGGATITGNLTLNNQGQLQLQNPAGTFTAALQAPILPANYTLTLPLNPGTIGQALTTDGSGILSWSTVPTMASTFVQNGNSFGVLATLGTNDAFGLNFETNGLTRMQISSSGTITVPGSFFADGGIDVTEAGGTDILNIGANNADTINLGTAATTQTINIGTGAGATMINLGGTGDTVTIAGTLTIINTTNLDVADKLITVNVGGPVSSGFNSGIQIQENGINTGYAKTDGTAASWLLKAPATAGVITLTPGAAGFTLNQGSHNPVTIGTANGLSLVGQVISLGLSSTTTTGALSNTDWDTFNNKIGSLLTNSGTATPSAGVLTISGGSNITTSGLGSTVTLNLNNSPSVSGTITAGGANITGPTTINTTGAAATSIATGGTGVLNLGNSTGNTFFTGNATLRNQGQLRLQNLAGTFIAALQTPALLANYTLTLPLDAGTAGQALTTDGTGVLSWNSFATTTAAFVQNGNSFGTLATLGTNDAFGLNLKTNSVNRIQITNAGAVTINTPTTGVGLTINGGGLTSTGTTTLSSFGAGMLSTNSSGVVASTATNNNTVQIGNAARTLTSLTAGTNGQVLLGATGAAPAFATLTSTGGTVTFTPGVNSLNLETSGATANSFLTNSGTAIPSAGALTILGGSNITTSGAGSTVTTNLNNSPSVSGSLTAGTTITAGTGITITTGGLTVNAGGATIVGIDGTIVGASSAVLVNSSGQLGTATSSRRYKNNITNLPSIENNFMQLRPVTFTYKTDSTNSLQYGLIAEEVETLFPDLIMYNNDGTVQTVQYHLLHAFFIKMIQEHNQKIDHCHTVIQKQNDALSELTNRIISLEKSHNNSDLDIGS